jgi:uncharacterized protein YecT (DUF1311 family)
MALSLRILSSAACALACAIASAEPAPPMWREDVTHLRDDVQAVEQCLASAAADAKRERACLDVIEDRCTKGAPMEEMTTTLFQRRCGWRAIAAWEDVLAGVQRSLEASLRPDERAPFARSAKAWTAFVDANVRSRSAEFEGGTLQGVVAGQVRARMTAERALELRSWLRDRDAE